MAARAIQRNSQLRGDLPGSLKRWIDSILHPKVHWQDVLRDFCTTTLRATSENNWSRPSRLALGAGLYRVKSEPEGRNGVRPNGPFFDQTPGRQFMQISFTAQPSPCRRSGVAGRERALAIRRVRVGRCGRRAQRLGGRVAPLADLRAALTRVSREAGPNRKNLLLSAVSAMAAQDRHGHFLGLDFHARS